MSLRITPIDARFSGRVVRTRHIGDLTLTETVFDPSSVVPLHRHDSSRLCLVLEGGFTEQVGGDARRCVAGSLLFHPADEPHAQRYDDGPSRCLSIQLGGCLTSRLSELQIRAPSRPIMASRRAAWLAMSLYDEFSRADGASELAAEGLCFAVLAELTRNAAAQSDGARSPRWLKVVQSLLDARYAEPVRLAELAAAVDVHPVHLSRVFHQRLGVTLTAYVRERRLTRAAGRLLQTDLPSSRIAIEAGFRDHGHFVRAFREGTGMTPREFRGAISTRKRPEPALRRRLPAFDTR
jgi:AraC family transcriptional regulator